MSYLYIGPYLLVVSAKKDVTRAKQMCSNCSIELTTSFCPKCGSKPTVVSYQVAQYLSHYDVLTVSSTAEELMELSLNRSSPTGPRPGTKYLYFVPNQKVSFQTRTISLDGLEEIIVPSEAEKDLAIEGMRTFAVDLIPSLSKAYESVEVKWGIFHYTFD